jgi:hypothetical protein
MRDNKKNKYPFWQALLWIFLSLVLFQGIIWMSYWLYCIFYQDHKQEQADFALPTPVAYVRDIENGALDEKGMLIPFAPFYFPKVLPSLILGKEKSQWKWGDLIAEKKRKVFFQLLSVFEKEPFSDWKLITLDLSRFLEESPARREVIAILQKKEEENTPLFFVRLPCDKTDLFLQHFFVAFRRSSNLFFDAESEVYVVDIRQPETFFLKTFSFIKDL